jgi:hypothetical protein
MFRPPLNTKYTIKNLSVTEKQYVILAQYFTKYFMEKKLNLFLGLLLGL